MLTTSREPGASQRAYRLRLMGTTDLVDADGRRVDEVLRQPKRLALLAYLCCEDPGGIHPRDRLLALFWSERPDRAARGALNQSPLRPPGCTWQRGHRQLGPGRCGPRAGNGEVRRRASPFRAGTLSRASWTTTSVVPSRMPWPCTRGTCWRGCILPVPMASWSGSTASAPAFGRT